MESFLTWAAPPLIGAFIGYLTNSVAIRMLFRPLRPWRIFGLRLPMTPGVIPSRRAQLARNIGEMVGAHLLTAEDVGAAMSREPFQDHLRNLIAMRLRVFCSRDFGTLPDMVPQELRGYLLSFVQLFRHRLGEELGRLVRQPAFEEAVAAVVREQVEVLLARECGQMLSLTQRRAGYAFLDEMVGRVLASPQLQDWCEHFLAARFQALLERNATLEQLLPEDIRLALPRLVEEHAPALIDRLAALLAEPEVRERLIRSLRVVIERFIASLGPLGAMAGNFLSPASIEEKIRSFLTEHEGEVSDWLRQPEVRQRLTALLLEQAETWLRTPLARLLGADPDERVRRLAGSLARQGLRLVREGGMRDMLAAMLRDNMEAWFEHGRRTVGAALFEVLRPETVRQLRDGFVAEVLHLLRARGVQRQIDALAAALVQQLVQQPLGMLDRIVPAPMRERIGEFLVHSANRILLDEVPGLLRTIDIRRLVQQRVDGLDLLRLEQLLLSIMEEQFRAINLFGGLLGFLIGCANLLPLVFWR